MPQIPEANPTSQSWYINPAGATCVGGLLLALFVGCTSEKSTPVDTPVALGSKVFSPASSQQIRFASPVTPLTILRGRRFDSDGDGDIDENDIDTSHQTREFTYSAETVADIPAVRIDVRYTDSGITTLSWSFSLARSTNGAVYVVKYADGGPFDFTAGVAGAEPVLFLPYDSTGTLAAGMTYQGGFNHQFTPLLTWSVEAVDVTSPLGLSNTTDLRVDMGTATDRHYWFSNSDGFVETDDGFSLALTPPG